MVRELVSGLHPEQEASLQSQQIVAGKRDINVLLHNELLKDMANPDVEKYETGNFAGQLSSCLSTPSSVVPTQEANRFTMTSQKSFGRAASDGRKACDAVYKQH